jgi:hypothetical protein
MVPEGRGSFTWDFGVTEKRFLRLCPTSRYGRESIVRSTRSRAWCPDQQWNAVGVCRGGTPKASFSSCVDLARKDRQ